MPQAPGNPIPAVRRVIESHFGSSLGSEWELSMPHRDGGFDPSPARPMDDDPCLAGCRGWGADARIQ